MIKKFAATAMLAMMLVYFFPWPSLQAQLWGSYLRTTGGTISTGGRLRLPDGSSAAPSLTWTNDSNRGFYNDSGAHTMTFGENGVDGYMSWVSSNFIRIKSSMSLCFSSGASDTTACDTSFTRALAGTFATSIGTGTAKANIAGTYAKFVSGTGVGNGADATDDVLWSLTAIPANSFTANGDALVLTLSFVTATNANNKRVGLTVGGTQVNTGTRGANAESSVLNATITRVDATHVNVVIGMGGLMGGSSLNLVVSDLTTNTLAVNVTGASPTSSAANDVKLYSGVADFKK